MSEFILASASPRRKESLEILGLKFEIIVSEAEENLNKNLPAELYVNELALIKASAVAKNIKNREDAIVIAADTVVYLDGEILEKPKDNEDAFNILKKLSKNTHTVFTGICVMRMKDGYCITKCVKTDVIFKELSDREIRNYISTGEPADKAGAYGIQGKGAVFVEKINGDYNNVVGLPISELYDILLKEFDIDIFDKE